MILYIENHKDSTEKKKKHLLKLINEFSKVVGYKINIQKLVEFLYTNNKIQIFLDVWWGYILINHHKLKISGVESAFNMPNLPNIMLSLAHLKHAQNALA